VKRVRVAETVGERLREVPGLTSLAVIGSTALGTATADSDVDMIGTIDDDFDSARWEAECQGIGNDPGMTATTTDPASFTAALRVRGVPVHVMLGPERCLISMAEEAATYDPRRLAHALPYGDAHALHDPKALWPRVRDAVKEAVGRRAGATDSNRCPNARPGRPGPT